MRVLLVAAFYADGYVDREIDAYLVSDINVVANTYYWPHLEQQAVRTRYAGNANVSFVCFDPSVLAHLLDVIQNSHPFFDAIVCPPVVDGITRDVLQFFLPHESHQDKLRAIGCPNDSISHLARIANLATENGIAIIHTPGVHAKSVAEYTLFQLGFHARRLAHFYEQTGQGSSWPHEEAVASTHLLYGRTLGVIGGSGKDGIAVTKLAITLGLQVIAVNSGASAGIETIKGLGATVAPNIDELLSRSDFISINCKTSEDTRSIIGSRQIERMKQQVILINASAAEVIDKQALLSEFTKPAKDRRLGVVLLDMPFGGRRDRRAFDADSDNAVLKNLGVLFTPRMAGYTVEGRLQAVTELADYLNRYLRLGDQTVPIANKGTGSKPDPSSKDDDINRLLVDTISLARQAGAEAIRLRADGLETWYKDDKSLITNADIHTEAIIKDGMRNRGYAFRFLGEEIRDSAQKNDVYEIVTDGIDGTRNFRDGNYGWCVSIAVRENGNTLVGVVHDPHTRETYFATRDGGAFVQTGEQTRPCHLNGNLPIDFSFSVGSFHARGGTGIKRLIIDDIKRLGGRGREWGSVALSICAVARGGLGTFIQRGSHDYDHTAAVLIAQEAGADVNQYQTKAPHVVDIIVSHPSLGQQVKAIFETRIEPQKII